MKDIFQNPIASIILLNDKLLETFFKKSAVKEGCLPSLLQHCTGDPSQYSKTRKKNGIRLGKEQTHFCFFQMIGLSTWNTQKKVQINY